MENKLKGLLLVGGKSSRMGEDKAHLCYRNDQPEWKRITALMEEFCEEVFLSCRPDQIDEFGYQTITDSGNGPLAAISEAGAAHPDVSWLVIACDLPLLDRLTIENLVNSRDPHCKGTHYKSSIDGFAEPLCSIYESNFFPLIKSAIADNSYCPRRLIQNSDSKLIDLTNSAALMNANSPADKIEIEAIITGAQVEKTIHLRYFAQLKELTGSDSETLKSKVMTPAGLFEQVKSTHRFPHKRKQLMVAINGDFSSWETLLNNGDEVVFIPPVAGG